MVGATNGGPTTVQGTILNDDGLPQIQVTSGNTGAQGKNEGNSGKTAFPIQISLVGANALATVEADWHTEDDAATLANNDLPGGERARDVLRPRRRRRRSPCSSTAT